MSEGPVGWRTPEVDELLGAILRLETAGEAAAFFRDLCTLGELHDMAQRWAVVRLLDAGEHYASISQETGASTATITRIASWLRHGEGGYPLALARAKAAGTRAAADTALGAPAAARHAGRREAAARTPANAPAPAARRGRG